MNRFGVTIVGAIALAMPGMAAAMPAAVFLAKTDALMAKGAAARMSSDLEVIKTEMARSMLQLKAERQAAIAEHRPVASCPSAKSSMSSNELVASMHRIPRAELAKMRVADALRYVLAHKYPCPR